jgi:signal recognition particle subunit SRP54
MMKRFQKGQFNMNDLKGQLEQMMKMGGMQGMMGMMPGMAKMQKQLDEAGFDDTVIKRQIALIKSMTKKERANPQILAGLPQETHRRRRGAGRVRPQQASEDAPPDGRRDEEARQDGQEGHAAAASAR